MSQQIHMSVVQVSIQGLILFIILAFSSADWLLVTVIIVLEEYKKLHIVM